MEEEQNSTEKP